MRISDWSSDVCSSDLCECRSSRAGAKVPSASLRGSSRNGVQENVVRRLQVEAEGPGGIIELGVLRLVALSRGRRRIRPTRTETGRTRVCHDVYIPVCPAILHNNTTSNRNRTTYFY